jgi:hypothetical protein
MQKQISKESTVRVRETVPVDLDYTRPPMTDDKDKEALRKTAQETPTFYATNARIRTNVHDISILFTRSVPVGSEADEVETSACVVSMSPALMMSLFRLVERHIALYTKKHAQLPDVVTFPKDEPDADNADGP